MSAVRNTMGGTTPRRKDDAYYTPDALALAICRKLREVVGTPTIIVEPSAGDGAFVRAAADVWGDAPLPAPIFAVEPNHIHNDPHAPGIWIEKSWEDVAWVSDIPDVIGTILIVGNPPYLLAESHIRLALERMGHFPPQPDPRVAPRYLAFLLRASFLAGLKRTESLWQDAPPRYVWHVAPRPSFTGGGTDGAEYAVITWQAGHRGPYEGGWLRWEK